MNETLKDLIRHSTACGTMLSEFYVPNVIRVFKACGFDYVIIDCEHGYFDFIEVANILSVARGYGLPAIVRLSKVDREFVLKYLDMGADGFLLSNTDDAAMIADLVHHAKYAPEGRRGISLQRAHTDYEPGKIREYLAQANAKTIILAQIESASGVENVEAILAVPGVDGVIIGPNDLALDLGVLGRNEAPVMVAAFEKVLAAALQAGKVCGLVSSNTDFLRKWEARGMRMLNWNSEIGMLLNEGKRGMACLRPAGRETPAADA